jgi:hypothetical protein
MAEDDDDDDEDEEYEEDGEENDEDEDDEDETHENYPLSNEDPIPSFELIFKKLMDKNVTYEQLVKSMMYGHLAFSFTENCDEYEKIAELVNEEIYDTIVNYKPEQEKLVEKSTYNFYFLEEEYKQREYVKIIENNIEQLLV